MRTPARDIQIQGAIGFVPLACGGVAIIDAADAEILLGLKWSAKPRGDLTYAIAARPRPARGTILLHRLIMDAAPGVEIDHVNGDPLDNRRANLRVATRAENMRNRRASKLNKTGFKGVTQDPRNMRFRAQIKVNGTTISLGVFGTAAEANEAYRAAATKHYGSFARAT